VKEGTFGEIGMADDGRHGNFIMRKRFVSNAGVMFSKSDNQVRRDSSVKVGEDNTIWQSFHGGN
jgi:hypothetical protein